MSKLVEFVGALFELKHKRAYTLFEGTLGDTFTRVSVGIKNAAGYGQTFYELRKMVASAKTQGHIETIDITKDELFKLIEMSIDRKMIPKETIGYCVTNELGEQINHDLEPVRYQTIHGESSRFSALTEHSESNNNSNVNTNPGSSASFGEDPRTKVQETETGECRTPQEDTSFEDIHSEIFNEGPKLANSGESNIDGSRKLKIGNDVLNVLSRKF